MLFYQYQKKCFELLYDVLRIILRPPQNNRRFLDAKYFLLLEKFQIFFTILFLNDFDFQRLYYLFHINKKDN